MMSTSGSKIEWENDNCVTESALDKSQRKYIIKREFLFTIFLSTDTLNKELHLFHWQLVSALHSTFNASSMNRIIKNFEGIHCNTTSFSLPLKL